MKVKSRKWLITYYSNNCSPDLILENLSSFGSNLLSVTFKDCHLYIELKTFWFLEDIKKAFPNVFYIEKASVDNLAIFNYVMRH